MLKSHRNLRHLDKIEVYDPAMQIEDFLQYDTLQSCSPDIAPMRESVGELAERHGVHHVFEPFDGRENDGLLDLRRAMKDILRDASTHPHLRRYVSDRKMAEVAGIAHHSGVVADTGSVHVYDACAGTGIVSHLISRLRGDSGRTSADCIELRQESAARFEHLRRILALGNPEIHFQNHAVGEKPFMAHEHRSTYVLAKHACGDAANDILEALQRSLPGKAVLLTCCHGASQKVPANALREGISAGEWRSLAQIADWTSAQETDKRIVGRAAMRAMDGLRIIGLSPGIKASVREIVDPKVSVKNQAICLQPAD